ncbi:Down syndrome cell adhesion molecule-like protein 1 homolog [Centruroides sculpturatus]|uniref:Down syndrome cell adhesion molecule-like protein 1 homolog n=1 Tax=Centruroides sculpturatus TaxID=218467 RepID=UPI000C6D8BE2|nr:Down syndrome cell adhesion molecule-like protein 1 homolog [Centruroides sculpturatus]
MYLTWNKLKFRYFLTNNAFEMHTLYWMCFVLVCRQLLYAEVNIEPFTFPKRVLVGQKTTATCLVSSVKSTSITFTWLRNGKEILKSQEIRVKNGNDFSLIIIDPVKVESGGNYTCSVSDGHTKTSFTSYLNIEG